MHQCDDWIICEHCDSVFESLPLKPGQTSICTRCDGVLQQGSALTIEQLFAISIASALLFVFANVFPVIDISFRVRGIKQHCGHPYGHLHEEILRQLPS